MQYVSRTVKTLYCSVTSNLVSNFILSFLSLFHHLCLFVSLSLFLFLILFPVLFPFLFLSHFFCCFPCILVQNSFTLLFQSPYNTKTLRLVLRAPCARNHHKLCVCVIFIFPQHLMSNHGFVCNRDHSDFPVCHYDYDY